MPPGLSLYLDAWRLGAALNVVLCHFASRRLSGGLLWQAAPYGAEAVDVFFVLSGYVIAHVAATRERELRPFAVNRAVRLWSTALPALLLTFALDEAGRALSPALYAALPGHPERLPAVLQAVCGLFFVNALWGADVPVGANVPWWSLGYEVPYYVAFAFAWFGPARWRLAGPVLVAAAAGPSIALLGILWIAGAAINRLHAKAPGGGTGVLAAACLPLWLGYEAMCAFFGRPFGWAPGLRLELAQDLIVGGLFAVHLLGAPALLARLPPCPTTLARVIRFGAARSFSLYLLHYPVMLFLRAVNPLANPIWVLPATLGVCVLVAEATERRAGFWRNLVLRSGRARHAPARIA